LKTKIYCDIADVNQIKRFNKNKLVKGFTTNPSLMRKAGAKNYEDYCKKILTYCKNKPVSFEVFADDYSGMKSQGHKISKWGKNVYVKIPVVSSKGKFSGKVIKNLNNNNIKLNVTAIYSFNVIKKITNLIDKKTKIILSVFVGRAADNGFDPIPEIKKIINHTKKFKNVEILWASVREPYNYLQAQQIGCHIITVPPSIISKIENFKKTSLSKLSKNTVKGFLIDAKKSNFKLLK